MSKKASLFFTVFGITVLIAIIAVFSLRVYFERKANAAENRENFKTLENTVASSYLAKGNFSHAFFSESMRQFIEKHPAYLSVVVYSAEGPHYIYAEDPNLLAFPADNHLLDWDGAPIFTIRPFFEEVLSSEISIPNRQGTFLSAVTVILPQTSLFLFIRDTIIAAAGLLVLTIIFIAVYPFMRERPANKRSNHEPLERRPSASSDHIPEPLAPVRQKPDCVEEKEPSSGLFSPETGLGWQQYLDSRLSFELRRSASYDQDLVLALFRGEGLQKRSSEYVRTAKFLLQHFLFQDMLFEYGQNGFAVILPNTELDEAIKEAETFIENVCEKNVSGCIFSVGISSRNGRLINGNRLITEASMALSKAFNDPDNKIIAFRSDPEKYRQYIASKA